MINNTIAEASASLKKEATVKFEELDKYLILSTVNSERTLLTYSSVRETTSSNVFPSLASL